MATVWCNVCNSQWQYPPGVAYPTVCGYCWRPCHVIATPRHHHHPHWWRQWYYGGSQQREVPRPLPRPAKRAVICGISYKDVKQDGPVPTPLKGPIKDAEFMKHLLVSRFHFSDLGICMLTDDSGSNNMPTSYDIVNALRWLVADCRPGDSLVFYFAGHGTQIRDTNGDEKDGMDEALVPLDYTHLIIDDMLNDLIVKPLPNGVTLHAIVDACHSGTILDLPYICRTNSFDPKWESNYPPDGSMKGTYGGLAICLSACDDHQLSIESKHRQNAFLNGALTFSLIEAIERGRATTYWDLFKEMKLSIDAGATNRGAATPLIQEMLENGRGGQKQIPQLSCSQAFDVKNTRFCL